MPMATRTHRARVRRADMQTYSDEDMEFGEQGRVKEQDIDNEDDEGSNVDIEAVAEGEGEDVENDSGEGDEDEDEDDAGDEDEDDQEDEIQSDADDATGGTPSTKASGSRLKVRLKMPTQSSSRHETPVIESEDSMSDSQPSTTRPMTARQAVLASVVDSSHVSLAGSRQKKAPLNETELALRREETARKRRNLTEKKLEDEKQAETINRLLKKQSRPRNKRATAQRDNMDDIAPSSMAGTRSNSNSTYNPSVRKKVPKKSTDSQDDGDEDDGMDEDNEDDEQPEREVPIPTMYRWVSTSRISPSQQGEALSTDVQLRITFSVPTSMLSLPEADSQGLPDAVPIDEKPLQLSTRPTGCAAPGCTNPFRYRLVKDWTRGACGISCLKLLESRMDTTT
ncbi:hypothetical protein DXG03_002101 [Asterophora parasitica]|uniref:INO80 complex subunit B-like conserved region domain-containing protein n=1 Tax=Asterophora parasitica TaxID=117018 RepID=A0A9P7KCE8_9AGAR|nr:hypothetical protein DXG03_002101 [Asterophora parasitica]